MLDETRAHGVHSSELCRVPTQSAGFIIVAVLWILAALATLAMIYALYVRETAIEFVDHDERLQAQALAISGIELAAYQLTKNPKAQPLEGQFSFAQGNATISVTFRSENSRIDLNFAPKELLEGLFSGLGVPRDDALAYAERIVAWRSPLKPGQNDPEAALYQAAGKTYGPRYGPFQHPNELTLLADIPNSVIDQVLPYVTVYSGRPEVNVLVAAPPVLAALPGMTPERLQLLLTLRQAGPQALATAQLGGAISGQTSDASRANRVSIDIRFRSGRRVHAEAVVLLTNEHTEPYRIVSWGDRTPLAGDRVDAGIR
jgi:general secretion pathway protein K